MEWFTQALRWLVLLGLLNLWVVATMTWVRWTGLAFGFEAAVFGPGSDWVLGVPFVLGAVVVGARAVVAFRRGVAEA